MRPIKISKKEWGLALIPAALALASIRPSDPYVVFPMLAISFLGCLFLAYHHEGRWQGKSLFVSVATIALSFIAWRELVGMKKVYNPLTIAMACEWRMLPIPIPAREQFWVYDAFTDIGGLAQITGGPTSSTIWPDGKSGEMYQCHVTNYSKEAVFHVSLEFTSTLR